MNDRPCGLVSEDGRVPSIYNSADPLAWAEATVVAKRLGLHPTQVRPAAARRRELNALGVMR